MVSAIVAPPGVQRILPGVQGGCRPGEGEGWPNHAPVMYIVYILMILEVMMMMMMMRMMMMIILAMMVMMMVKWRNGGMEVGLPPKMATPVENHVLSKNWGKQCTNCRAFAFSWSFIVNGTWIFVAPTAFSALRPRILAFWAWRCRWRLTSSPTSRRHRQHQTWHDRLPF